jgi:SulP family sulfate permease
MRNVPAMDSTGLAALRDLVRRSHRDGTQLLLAGVHAQPMTVLARSGLLEEIGEENMTGTIEEAVAEITIRRLGSRKEEG